MKFPQPIQQAPVEVPGSYNMGMNSGVMPGPQMMHDPVSNPDMNPQAAMRLQQQASDMASKVAPQNSGMQAQMERMQDVAVVEQSNAEAKAAELLGRTKAMIIDQSPEEIPSRGEYLAAVGAPGSAENNGIVSLFPKRA